MRAQNKAWEKKNPKKRRQIVNRWQKRNPEKMRQKAKRYYAKNKKKCNEMCRVYAAKRYKADPTYRIMKVMRARHHAALKGKLKLESTKALLGCSSSEWRAHLERMWYDCAATGTSMSWENYGQGPGTWQIDHRVPMCSFDLGLLEAQRQANHYTNTQPLWYVDHCKKGTLVPSTHEWNGTSWQLLQ